MMLIHAVRLELVLIPSDLLVLKKAWSAVNLRTAVTLSPEAMTSTGSMVKSFSPSEPLLPQVCQFSSLSPV